MSAGENKLKDILFWDLERELTITRRVLEAVPQDKFAWKPHENSMSLARLAMHVATMPGWIKNTLESNEFDASKGPRPRTDPNDRADLLATFDKEAAAVRALAAKFDAEAITQTWTMRNGPQVMTTQPRATVYRIWCVNHMVHHRGQLCLYLRLLNIPVPTVYFNTADDPTWRFE
jgi:uncharacterized damage-inducible protein DinB